MTKSFRTLDDVDVKGKRVLLRVDLNVPTENGRVTDTTRLERIGPTITEISAGGGKVILLAHSLGRDDRDSRSTFQTAPSHSSLRELWATTYSTFNSISPRLR